MSFPSRVPVDNRGIFPLALHGLQSNSAISVAVIQSLALKLNLRHNAYTTDVSYDVKRTNMENLPTTTAEIEDVKR